MTVAAKVKTHVTRGSHKLLVKKIVHEIMTWVLWKNDCKTRLKEVRNLDTDRRKFNCV